MHKTGILLLNLGTPDAPTLWSVGRYLRTFLMDGRVVSLPYPLRWLLVHGIILPFRTPKTTKLYQKIWQPTGSPLLANSQSFAVQLSVSLGEEHIVSLGMRYGQPDISGACKKLLDAGCEKIIVLPLFPQYSSAATGSALAKVYEYFSTVEEIPTVVLENQFFDAPFYIDTLAVHIQSQLKGVEYDCLLFSYHGLPAKYQNYRRQCEQTTQLLANRLGLTADQFLFSFQSRLGRLEWLRPYTDECLITLRERGVKSLAVVCPSFVADCLETLEEINIGIRERWESLGGESFHYVPCLNSDSNWVQSCASWLKLI